MFQVSLQPTKTRSRNRLKPSAPSERLAWIISGGFNTWGWVKTLVPSEPQNSWD